MRKLSEYKDEEALDLLADILDPVCEIFVDKAVITPLQSGNKVKAVSVAIKNHKKEVVEIMATLNGVEVKDFHYNIVTLPKMVLEILNDKDLLDFFSSQGEEVTKTPFGSVTEATEDEESSDSLNM